MKRFLSIIIIFFIPIVCISQFGQPYDISKSLTQPWDVKLFDLDGDGDDDILTASGQEKNLGWYENLGGGSFGTYKIISTSANYIKSVYAADLDNDGDMDVLSASEFDDRIAWYENTGNGQFGPIQNISTNADKARCVYAVDLDNDGDADVLSASTGDNKLALYENLGNGLFAPEVVLSTSSSKPTSVVSGDLDNDGDEDILCGFDTGNKTAWLENLGNGSFGPQQDIAFGSGVVSVYSADMDNDGDLDVYSALRGSDRVVCYENLGGAVFGPQIIINNTAQGVYSVHAADLDNDGDMEVISGTYNGHKVSFHENLGGSTYGPEQILSNTAYNTSSVFSVDIENDGDIDIISASLGDNEIRLFENFGGLIFSSEQVISSCTRGPTHLFVADINGDGDADVVTTSTYTIGNSRVSWFQNLGGGKFGVQNIISYDADNPSCVEAVDIDNDGDMDVISGSYGDDKIAWYENNGNGVFGPEQIITTNALGVKSISAFDADGDGDIDIVSASNNGIIEWHENLGGGSFSPDQAITFSALNPNVVITTDIDNDGDDDIVSASTGDDKLAWYENLGGGSFGPQQVFSVSADGPNSLHSADINGDGNIDIVSSSYNDNKIAWYPNLGGGSFGAQQVISTNMTSANSVFAIDLDGDSDIDVLSTSNLDNKISWYQNLGAGTFGPQIQIDTGAYSPKFVSASDIDSDGDPDILSLGGYADVLWYENYFNFSYIKGNIFYDANQNATRDSGEIGLTFIPTFLQPDSLISFTNNLGEYSFSVDSGSYIIDYIPDTMWNLTTDSINYYAEINGASQLVDSLDFGFYPDTIATVLNPDLTGGLPRCNEIINYWINIQNLGTTLPSGIIHLQLDNAIGFISSTIPPDSINGQNVYWHYDSLNFYSFETIDLNVQMPTVASIGDTLISSVTVHELDGSNNIIYSKEDSLSQILICSYDPNDKSVLPKGLGTEGYILNNQKLEYLIRFQNTGTDTAITVMVRDQLDSNLNWNTLQPISSSHPMQLHIEQNGEAVFKFNNIMLPDSGADFLGSQGFVKFSIDMNQNLPPGTQIFNTGHIYFDLNPAVITNSVLNTIYDCTYSPIYLSRSTICLGETIEAYCSEGEINDYIWDIDTFYNSYSDTLSWVSDTVGNFSLKMSVENLLCSKDTTVSIIVLPKIPISNNNQTICSGDSIFIYGNIVGAAGVYYDTLQSFIGCDSVLSTTLLVNPVYSSNQNQSICQGDSLLVYGIYQSTAGTYYDSLLTINGCDSVLSTTLSIDSIFSVSTSDTICQGDSLLIFGNYENTAGIYYDSLQTIHGCDSLLSSTLHVNSTFTTNFNDTICQGDSILIHGIYQNSTGTYYDSLQSFTGCDSVLVSDLFVNPVYSWNQNTSICQGDSTLIYGNYQSNAGVYYDSLQTIFGCDSILSTTLLIDSIYSSVQNLSICTGDSVLIYGLYQNSAGIYYDSLLSVSGCDSIQSTVLSVNPVYSSSQNQSICQGDSLLINGVFQNTAGIYIDSLQSVYGCDSIISTTLGVDPLPNVNIASFNSDSLCLNGPMELLPLGTPSGGTYSGLGVTGGNFDPLVAGVGYHSVIYSYSDSNSCFNSDTSFVTVAICAGINTSEEKLGVLIYPNPNTGVFNIDKPIGLELKIKILDVGSKVILSKSVPSNQGTMNIDISSYSNGIYYLHLIVNSEIAIKQIVKQ